MEDLKKIMRGGGLLPFKIVHEKTCEVMGLELGSIHLGHFDVKRCRIDLFNSELVPYMSLTPDSAVPMHITDKDCLSVLSKMYVARILSHNESGLAGYKRLSKALGVSVPTIKRWVKKYT